MTVKQKSPKRIVALFDQHYPHTIPAFWNHKTPKVLSPVFKFIRDFDPHIIVHGGDQLDLGCVSHWNRGKPKLIEGKRLADDYKGYNLLLDTLEKQTKSLETHTMLQGNHDYWIDMLVEEFPQAMEGMIEVQKNLNLASRGIKWVENGRTWNAGKLYFHHGDWKKGYLPEYHAKAIGMTFGKNMLYGHTHTEQAWTKVSPIDEHAIQTQCVGTLSNLNPAWMRNSPNAWVNSFWVGHILSNGNYYGHTVKIIGGEFMYDGQLYK